ncbi:MAG: hypothetical protein DI626_02210 [Micavibrio aeruginosavorus]|uniref:Glucuronosyltransferase GumK N-terminal domain-containing protein n=1 Tax=Micavibrio aeruginosavorus TaxID=349221 RepID=A0A2W5A118_9BACT|nr:MAG: hypothetical protein DI626_02210 [Micavibrio aeruginosavorus]
MLVPHIFTINPDAKFIYNYSDRFSVVKFHEAVKESHYAALPYFDLIRLNSAFFKEDFPADVETHYIQQAIDKSAFDRDIPNPYSHPHNVICVGDMIFDPAAVQELAAAYPDWRFHLFGKGARLDRPYKNVYEYGEMPFEDIIPYIKHADVALAPYKDIPEAEYLSQSSLKLVQYTYCRLPIVAPNFASQGRNHVIPYTRGNEGPNIQAAFFIAQSFDRSSIDINDVSDWTDVIDFMIRFPFKDKIIS